MVTEAGFREDLFYRLNVLSVRLPPLRERSDDIPLLVQHFMARTAGRPRGGLRDATSAALRRVRPGNVRQLENVVRRAMVTWKRGDPLRLSDLPPELWLELAHLAGPPRPEPESPTEAICEPERGAAPVLLDAVGVLQAASWQLDRALALCEQKMVNAALDVSSGNRSRAARLLGISPRSIFNKLRKHQA